jgi:hypothetical protein
MNKVVNVICLDCNVKDVANWNDFGAEQSCLYCDAPAVNLIKVGK